MTLTPEQQAALDNVESDGEMCLSDCDDANIPVNIFISKEEDGRWRLSGDNFMPRKGLGDGMFQYMADNPEPLRELVRLFVKPHYEKAMKMIDGLIDGSNNSFYYWDGKLKV